MTDRITFARNGQIRRGNIGVGWIDDDYDARPKRWTVRFTAASGIEGFLGRYKRLGDAKWAARNALEGVKQ